MDAVEELQVQRDKNKLFFFRGLGTSLEAHLGQRCPARPCPSARTLPPRRVSAAPASSTTYTFAPVQPGVYDVETELAGFSIAKIRGVPAEDKIRCTLLGVLPVCV
jgi:hypothetical protein